MPKKVKECFDCSEKIKKTEAKKKYLEMLECVQSSKELVIFQKDKLEKILEKLQEHEKKD